MHDDSDVIQASIPGNIRLPRLWANSKDLMHRPFRWCFPGWIIGRQCIEKMLSYELDHVKTIHNRAYTIIINSRGRLHSFDYYA